MNPDEPVIDFVTFLEYSWVKEKRNTVLYIVPDTSLVFSAVTGWIIIFVFLVTVTTRRTLSKEK